VSRKNYFVLQLINMVDVKSIQSGTVFAWFMLVMVTRRIVILVIAGVAGRHKPFLAGSRPPEDKMLKNKDVDPWIITGITQLEFTKDVRANRIIGNDSENDTYFLVLLLATAVFSDDVSGSSTRTIVYGIVYLFARILYAVAYIMALQPWRTLAYSLGLLCTLVCNLDLVITMSMRSN
jgi:uncharacterized MAPEG superfamily protein